MVKSPTPDGPNQEGGSFVEGRLLDGFLLLAAGGSASPDDVVVANLSSLQIVDVAPEDLSYFHNLHKLDASDNQLGYDLVLQHMARIPRLTNLSLACNSICSLDVPVGLLQRLEILDLSFNELHGEVLSALGALPALKTLNLSSNCISSMPPEQDLYGLESLEELVLDSNDLVQFVQWRALDALPKLRKLSLSSNRVKRLKDDTEVPGDTSYFPTLEELDLSGNEIASVHNLPVVRHFRGLKNLNLSDNPCTKDEAAGRPPHGVKVLKQESKPWYLRGNGSHQRREKPNEPKVKMNRKTMRRVRSSPHELPGSGVQAYKGSMLPVGVFDEEANTLMVSFGSHAPSSAEDPVTRVLEDGDDSLGSFFVTDGGVRGHQYRSHLPVPSQMAASTLDTGPELLSDDISEQELDEIFRQQRARIASRFHEDVEEPTSFMRARPFEVTTAAGHRLGLSSRPPADDDGCSSRAPGSPASVRRVSSSSRIDFEDDSGERRPRGHERFNMLVAQHHQSQVVPLPPIRSSGADLFGNGPVSLAPTGPGVLANYREKPPGRPKPPAEFGAMEAFKALRAIQRAEFVL